MAGTAIIKVVDLSSETFQRTLQRLKPDLLKEARKALGELFLLDMESAPAKLHLHPLKDLTVPSRVDLKKQVKVYTIHLNSGDTHKASFTFEDGTAYMRTCGTHAEIDKKP